MRSTNDLTFTHVDLSYNLPLLEFGNRNRCGSYCSLNRCTRLNSIKEVEVNKT